jgi:hypothetical protein
MGTKENFLPPTPLQRLAEGTNNMSECFVDKSEHLEGAGKERVAISLGKSVKCLPALRHKYNGVKYRDCQPVISYYPVAGCSSPSIHLYTNILGHFEPSR